MNIGFTMGLRAQDTVPFTVLVEWANAKGKDFEQDASDVF